MLDQIIRNAGLKVTAPRKKILGVLKKAALRHVTAEDVYRLLLEAGEQIGQATVYRVLTQFESAGLVRRRHFEGGQSVFELNQGEHHDHIVCVTCGRVEEFYDETIERRQDELARKQGFLLDRHALTIYGQCADAQCLGKRSR